MWQRWALEDSDRGYGRFRITFEAKALEHLVEISNGDARTLLNALELAVETSGESFPPPGGSEINISLRSAEESIQRKVLLYDKEGDYHFDTISAFIKSIRGSDPDATLYWMARMIRAGEDPRYIFRRMLISASEDVGMADPNALVVVQSCAASFDRVGMPEGQFHLAQSAIYLATAKKSNSTLGFFDALASLESDKVEEVPAHLKDGNRDSKGFGHGEGYLYPHAFRDHWVAQQYLPNGLKGNSFYAPSDQGYERHIKDEVEEKRQLQLEIFAPNPHEILTFSPENSSLERWIDRTQGEEARFLQEVSRQIFQAAGTIPRHSRIYVATPGYGYLLWEALRHAPEGQVSSSTGDEKAYGVLRHRAEEIDELYRPQLQLSTPADFLTARGEDVPFELIIGNGLIVSSPEKQKVLDLLLAALDSSGTMVLCEPLVYESSRLSGLLQGPAIPGGRACRLRRTGLQGILPRRV